MSDFIQKNIGEFLCQCFFDEGNAPEGYDFLTDESGANLITDVGEKLIVPE